MGPSKSRKSECYFRHDVKPLEGFTKAVGMEAFDELLSINVPWSQEFPGVRVWT